jgi:hypothetical protein
MNTVLAANKSTNAVIPRSRGGDANPVWTRYYEGHLAMLRCYGELLLPQYPGYLKRLGWTPGRLPELAETNTILAASRDDQKSRLEEKMSQRFQPASPYIP